MNFSLRLTLSFAFLLSVFQLFGQMEVIDGATPPVDPVSLINNIFLGDGVEVVDVTYQGDPIAVGLFTNGQNVIGLDRGIIMTTGRAASPNCGGTLGANCNGNQFSSNDNNGPMNDPDLNAIAGLATNDAARFTITFIPTADTLRFRYVFASEEYPEFACSAFNDAFGFFISGPGINGPYSNSSENIALIPGTNIPVSINNVNNAGVNVPGGCNYDYANFYNDNNNMGQQPVYDAYLDVFTAEYIVTPCETYTMKLAVGDGGDSFYDTGVFLEAKSFGTGSLQVETATVSLDGTITEGCSDGTISFNLPSPELEDFPLDYTIIGTAENGIDYLEIPSDLVIPAGDTSLSIDIIAIEDFIDEGLESIGIDIQRDVCNRDTFWIFIRDNEIVPPDLGPDTSICEGDSLVLNGELPIPLPVPPSFTNTQDYFFDEAAPVFSPILVAGVQPPELQEGVIQSVCLNIDHPFTDDVDIFLISPAGQFLELSTDNGQDCDDFPNTCFTPTATTQLTDVIPVGYDCAGGESTTFTGDFMAEGVWEDLWDGEYPTNGTWQLLVLDDAMGFDGTLLDWTITFEPLYQLFYEWTPATGLSCSDCPNPVASPSQTTTYTLRAWDTYGCEVSDSITIEVEDFVPAPTVNCTNITDSSITFEWNDVPGAMGYFVSVNGNTFTVPNNGPLSHVVNGLNLGTEVTIEVFAIGGCDGEIGTATCQTPDCDAATLTVIQQNNLLCAGDSNGSIEVEATGGAGNYSYEINGVSNPNGLFENLSAGTYNITVIDAWMCPNTIQVNITEPDILLINPVFINDVSCFGADDASATVEVEGGVYPFQYNWSSGQTDSIGIGLPSGIVQVEVTDANGCTITAEFEFNDPPMLTANMSTDSVDCFTASTGSALVTPNGGTEPWTYLWDSNAGNATTAQVDDLPAGTYDVVVTDLNGCQITVQALIEEPDGMQLDLTSTPASCANSSDASATAMVSGGAPNYEYLWSNGQAGETATFLDALTYQVTVTDANGCSVEDSVTVSGPPVIELSLEKTDALCYDGNSGTVNSNVAGGFGTFTYSWNNGSSSPNLTNLAAGEYCVTVTDSNGCTEEACIDVGQPDEFMLLSDIANPDCFGGSDGSIDNTISGGTEPYSYLWNNGETTQDISQISAGSYVLTVTDANLCAFSWSFEIIEVPELTLQATNENVLCFGEATGTIELTADGGQGGFTFEWSGPNNYSSNEEDPQNLEAGIYTVIVTDLAGCSSQLQIEVEQPATPVSINIATPDEICFGATNGGLSSSATGGVLDYSFAWNNGATSSDINGLSAGLYSVTVTDANNCSAEASMAIIEQDIIEVELAQVSASCAGAADGEASISSLTQGGVNLSFSDVQILWSIGGATSPEITGLIGGATYAVTVTNNLGCSASAEITIDDPVEIGAALVNSIDASCHGGDDASITVTGEGGTTPYSYLWDFNTGNQTTATASGLNAGTFAVTVTDSKGCFTVFEASVGQPEALGLSFQTEKVSCFGRADGTAVASAEGGTGPYQFVWENGQTGTEANNLSAGDWGLTLTDINGCTLTSTAIIAQPNEPLSATPYPKNVSCYGYRDGSIVISTDGGSPPYRYSLDGVNYLGTPKFIALEADEYTVYIRDNNGCEYEIDSVNVWQPVPISVDLGADTTVNFGASIQIEPTLSGIPPQQMGSLVYEWNSNNSQTPVLFPDIESGIFEEITSPASISLTITTERGCTAEDLMNIFVKEFKNVEVPTGFAPDGNSLRNHALHVHGNSELVDRIKIFQVFDRWGELLFEIEDFSINDETVGWDGTFKNEEMPAGVYIWYLEVDFIDGETVTYKGQTTLIR